MIAQPHAERDMSDLLETSENGITTLTLNRPERLNALSPAMTSALKEALERLSTDRDCGAIVITGVVSLLNFEMTGGRVSGGRSRTIVATRSRMSCAAVSMSRFKLNVAMTKEFPWPETDRPLQHPNAQTVEAGFVSAGFNRPD